MVVLHGDFCCLSDRASSATSCGYGKPRRINIQQLCNSLVQLHFKGAYFCFQYCCGFLLVKVKTCSYLVLVGRILNADPLSRHVKPGTPLPQRQMRLELQLGLDHVRNTMIIANEESFAECQHCIYAAASKSLGLLPGMLVFINHHSPSISIAFVTIAVQYTALRHSQYHIARVWIRDRNPYKVWSPLIDVVWRGRCLCFNNATDGNYASQLRALCWSSVSPTSYEVSPC
jgi:hypothetical protein